MDNDIITLNYINEDDRAFGLAGMSISLAALDALDRVASVSLDSEGPMVIFSNEYYFPGSPALSPKVVWDNLLHNFYITSAMVISNVMARSMVRMRREVPLELMEAIRSEMREEGRESCSLDEDEVEALYNKTRSYMGRIFRNPRLHPAINDFAHTISRRRTLSGREIRDELQALDII